MNQILTLNNPEGVDMPLNKPNQIWTVIITIKHLQMNQILALNNPEGVDMLLIK